MNPSNGNDVRLAPSKCIGQRFLTRYALVLGLSALGAAATGQAVAGCGQFGRVTAPPAQWDAPVADALLPAVYRPGAGQFIRVLDDGDRHVPNIVGMWRFTMVSDGTAYPVPIPYGAPIDFGTVQLHSDGTELMISGGRAPSTGDVCMGVWEQTGKSTYKVKHFALGWVSGDSTPPASPSAFLGPAVIHEAVTLNGSGNRFEGTFTIDQYAKDEVTLLEHISGKVIATRFTVD